VKHTTQRPSRQPEPTPLATPVPNQRKNRGEFKLNGSHGHLSHRWCEFFGAALFAHWVAFAPAFQRDSLTSASTYLWLVAFPLPPDCLKLLIGRWRAALGQPSIDFLTSSHLPLDVVIGRGLALASPGVVERVSHVHMVTAVAVIQQAQPPTLFPSSFHHVTPFGAGTDNPRAVGSIPTPRVGLSHSSGTGTSTETVTGSVSINVTVPSRRRVELAATSPLFVRVRGCRLYLLPERVGQPWQHRLKDRVVLVRAPEVIVPKIVRN
jgi:hypothetical protein